MKIITRAEAKSQGLKRYFTGKLCVNSHLSERYTRGGNCVECNRSQFKDWAAQNPERSKTRKAEWFQANPEKACASVARRKAAKLLRTPPWADLETIKLIYTGCPKGMTVDHIFPLQGETVSGLHVPENLQYLTPSQNSSKRNRISPGEFPAQQLPNLDVLAHRVASLRHTLGPQAFEQSAQM